MLTSGPAESGQVGDAIASQCATKDAARQESQCINSKLEAPEKTSMLQPSASSTTTVAPKLSDSVEPPTNETPKPLGRPGDPGDPTRLMPTQPTPNPSPPHPAQTRDTENSPTQQERLKEFERLPHLFTKIIRHNASGSSDRDVAVFQKAYFAYRRA